MYIYVQKVNQRFKKALKNIALGPRVKKASDPGSGFATPIVGILLDVLLHSAVDPRELKKIRTTFRSAGEDRPPPPRF
jgi:hypothetical protein